ncbi:transducin/WD40 repeat-like superfamily protein, partial [Tanacetum coccineum]
FRKKDIADVIPRGTPKAKETPRVNDPRQQNVINQQSLNKQASGAQYAPLISGTPVRDPSQIQVLHSSGLTPQLIEGTPIPTPQHGYRHFPRFLGDTRKSSGELVDTVSRSSMNDQLNVTCQERSMFGSVSSQGSDQQESGRGQEQGIDQDVSGLDPMEHNRSWSALMQSALEETSSTDTGSHQALSGPTGEYAFVNNAPNNDMEFKKESDDGTAKLWDLRQRGAIHTFSDKYQVTAVAFSDTSDKIYSGGIDNVVKVWDLRRNEVTMTLEGHQNMITVTLFPHPSTSCLSNVKLKMAAQRGTEPGQVGESRLLLRLKENHVGWIVIIFGGDDGGGGRAALEVDAFLAAGEELYICHH